MDKIRDQDDINNVPVEQKSDHDDPNSPESPRKSFEKTARKPVSRFRSVLPQVLSVTAKNLVLFDLGMTMAFPTIVIPVLLDQNLVDSKGLTFDESQASWFASIGMICQPLGSALSGMVSAPLGRKRSLMLVNIPQIIGWLMLYSASSVEVMYAATALQGLGAGFMDAPIFTYVGEICEPSLRGVLISYSLQFCSIGFLLQCILGSLTHWRNVALISIIFPALAFISISQIPETPMWLLSKNRFEEAEKALCWLRGWVPKELVAQEFTNLIKYNKNSKYSALPVVQSTGVTDDGLGKEPAIVSSRESVANPQVDSRAPDDTDAYDKQTLLEKIKDLLRPEIIRPMTVITILNLLYYTSGFHGFKTYMVLIFQRLHVPLDANWASVWVSTANVLSHMSQMVTVKFVGKRFLTLLSAFGCALCCFAVAVHISFQPFFNGLVGNILAGWLLFSYFIALSFFVKIGLAPIPWMLMSEIFPFRGRSFASGVCAAIYYTMSFFASKTYLNLLLLIGITGSQYLFGLISAVGFIYVYLYLPETEGLSLEEIEVIYRKKTKAKGLRKKSASKEENHSEQRTSDNYTQSRC